MPSIRIDDSVWDWLKKHARPLEDTPNSVLRRLAGLDPSSSEERAGIKPIEERKIMETPKFRFSGEQLRKENSLPVHHCLYHKDGKFYEKLTDFPGALCDPRGYLQFDTETEFKNDPRLNIGRKVNVPRGISTHPKYQTFPSAKSSEVSRLLLIRKESMTMTPPQKSQPFILKQLQEKKRKRRKVKFWSNGSSQSCEGLVSKFILKEEAIISS